MRSKKSRRVKKQAQPVQQVNLRWIWVVPVAFLLMVAFAISHPHQPAVAPVAEPVRATSGSETASPAVVDKDLTWDEQQKIWHERLASMREVVALTRDPDGQQSLEYIERNGRLVNTAAGMPAPPKSPLFNIVVLDSVTHAQWQEGLSKKREVLATYSPLPQIMTLKRDLKTPSKLMGITVLHEGVHAMHMQGGQLLSDVDRCQDEVYAYTAQNRQFRALYPNYEKLREQMVASIERDMKGRRATAHTPEAIALARVPQIQSTAMWLLVWPEEMRKAFGYPADTDINMVIDVYLNIASLDASFEAIDQTSKTPAEAKDVKLALVRYLYRIMGV